MKRKNIIFILIIASVIIAFKIYYDNEPLEESEALNLKNYLGIEYNKLNNSEIKKLNAEINTINNIKPVRKNIDKYNLSIDKLNKDIKNMGINLPYSDFEDYLEDNKSKLNKKDYNELLDITDQMDTLQAKIDKINASLEMSKLNDYEYELNELNNRRGQLLIKNHLDPYEIKRQLDEKTANYSIIPIENGNLLFSKNANKENLLIYNNIWNEIKKIVPENYRNYLIKMQVFTDGADNTLAYMITDDLNPAKWIISVDLIDSLNYKGEFTKDFTDTLIHEFMHLITLNESQMQQKPSLFGETYTTDEGSLKKDSYLNLFYEKFWKNYLEYIDKIRRINLSDDDKLILTEDFYNEHKNDFVSEYAATNPEEDIAETFMYFVTENMPKTNTVRDQKIKFMYSFKELVEIRNYIRNNLKTY